MYECKYLKKILLLGLLGAGAVMGLIVKRVFLPAARNGQLTIGIIQTASHPALDSSREGFIKELKDSLGSNVKFVIQNGEGMISQLQSIARKLKSGSMDAYFAIGTPAAQVISNLEKEKPIILTAVTDAKTAGLVAPNICGVSDLVNIGSLVKNIKLFFPDWKKIALLFKSSEVNSVFMVEKIIEELKKVGIEAIKVGMTTETEVPSAVDIACKKADAILCPNDNLVAVSLQTIGAIALRNKKPLITTFISSKDSFKSLLAAQSVDYFDLGKKSAQITFDVLKKKRNVKDVGFLNVDDDKFFINKRMLQVLGIALSEKLEKQANFLDQY